MTHGRPCAALLFALLASGCASKHERFEAAAADAPRSATLIVVTPEESISKQFIAQRERTANFTLAKPDRYLVTATVSLMGFGAGLAWLGSAGVAGTSIGTTATAGVVALPVAGAMAAIFAGQTLVDLSRKSEAEAAITSHRAALAEFDTRAQVGTALSAHGTDHPAFDFRSVRSMADLLPDADAEARDALASLDTRYAVTLSVLPQFTPAFEALEVQALVAVFDLEGDRPERPVYANRVIYQSPFHGGRLEAATRDQLEEMLAAFRADLEARKRDAHGGQLPEYARRDVLVRTRQERDAYYEGYRVLDEHDPRGEVWLAFDAQTLFATLRDGIDEVTRVALADLGSACPWDRRGEAALPGSSEPGVLCAPLSGDDREVYRVENGTLFSIDARSRFLPLEM